MPAIETSIWLALRGRVETLVLNPVHPIAWPNEAFTPPQSGTPPTPAPYLRITHLPNVTDRLFLKGSDRHRYQGILQIAAMYPLSRPHGETQAREIAAQTAAHFPADLVLRHGSVAVKIEKRPDVLQGIREDDTQRWMTPVSIRYRAFV